MTEIIYDKWLIECNVDATRKAYGAITKGDADKCDCVYCQNLVLSRKQFYSHETLTLLDQLGIDYMKDAEANELGKVESGLHLYDVWFYFVGKVEEKFTVQTESKGYFSIYFAPADGTMAAQSFANQPLGKVSIVNEIPWLLEESYE